MDEVLYYNLEDDGFVSIQHKGRVDKFNKWNDIKNSIIESVFNLKEIDGIAEKRKIFNDDVINCAGIQKNTNNTSKFLKIVDLFTIEKGTLASDDNEDGEFDFITGADDWKKHSSYVHDKEALVFVVGAAGSLGKCHYVNGKFTASNLCLILTPKNMKDYPINLQFYNAYFNNNRKKIVSDLADGTSKLTIGKPIFQKYYVDYIPLKIQNNFVDKYIITYKQKIGELKALLNESEKIIDQNLKQLI